MSAAEARHTRGLEELRARDADRFGGKSASLGELLHAGIPVPPGFAISTEAGEDLTDILRRDIAARYGELGDDVPVAVRSSALGEDSAEATFAGQQDTYLWVRGIDAICDAVTEMLGQPPQRARRSPTASASASRTRPWGSPSSSWSTLPSPA